MDHEETLLATYVAFNARDAEAVVAQLADDVDWPNAWEGGRLRGHAAVRDYWRRQWAEVDPSVEPVAFAHDGDTVAVTVAQSVRDLRGTVVAEGTVIHRYAFDAAGRVTRMDVEEP